MSQAAVRAHTANNRVNGSLCRFEAELYALTKEEGGRHTPFFTKYRPQFFFRTADVTGAPGPSTLPETYILAIEPE